MENEVKHREKEVVTFDRQKNDAEADSRHLNVSLFETQGDAPSTERNTQLYK